MSGTLQTTATTSIDLRGYSGIIGTSIIGVGGMYAISLDGSTTWKSRATGSWTPIEAANIATQGMPLSVLNAITSAQWSEIFQRTQLDILVSLSNTDSLTSIIVNLPSNYAPLINNPAATPNIHNDNVILTADLVDPEDDVIRYQILVNGDVYQDWIVGNTINFSIPNNLFNVGLNPITINARDVREATSSSTLYVTRVNSVPYQTVGILNMCNLTASISDDDGDAISYRILVNSVVVQDWSVLTPSPININYTMDRTIINFGVTNTVTIEYKDSLGVRGEDYTELFIGTYYGLLFADVEGDFYSTDAGVILKRVDMGVLIVGQTTLPQTVKIINTSGVALQNIILNVDFNTVASNTTVKLDYDGTAFEGKDTLTFNYLNNGDSADFQIQVSANSNAQAGSIFRITATGEPI